MWILSYGVPRPSREEVGSRPARTGVEPHGDEVRKIRIELKAGVSVGNGGEEGRRVSFELKFR